jgi:phenylalanyl-tRNA synthetase beta chain
MKISYKWLCSYLPWQPEPEELSRILTSIGLEVEELERYEEVRGGMAGLVIGEVLEASPHPNADKLKLTRVNVGEGEPLKIVCGAPNVAARQKVVVAPVGSVLYPLQGGEVKMKLARIRGEESQGMILAPDELGWEDSHAGILVLDPAAVPGTAASDYFHPYEDYVYEIGLTPNRMDAMSHLGVARDVCAWKSNEKGARIHPLVPPAATLGAKGGGRTFTVELDNTADCPRYSGVSVTGIRVAASPLWLRQRLKAVGVRPINNIVDITNFILQECGQPLHAFDASRISGDRIIVKNLPDGTAFTTLDGKQRRLDATDLVICDAKGPMCLAGIFGGLGSGVTDATTEIFLESACFGAAAVRRSSFRHDLRTEAALRFEKGVDISGTIYALQRAVSLMEELAGAHGSSDIVDVYPEPRPRTFVHFRYDYLDRLSGKAYEPARVRAILESLGFDLREEAGGFGAEVPYSKPDIALPADLAEEVMRIDGYDNVPIPTHVRFVPAQSLRPDPGDLREKVASYLTAAGFYEIFTNSITGSNYYGEDQPLITLRNNLSSELDVLRPSLLETGLEAVAYNLNRRQGDLLFFEYGKSYLPLEDHAYSEREWLALYLTGNKAPESWLTRPAPVDIHFLKGHLDNIFSLAGAPAPDWVPSGEKDLSQAQRLRGGDGVAGRLGLVSRSRLQPFGIRQPVWYAELDWASLVKESSAAVTYREVPRFPSVRRDLALILDKQIPFADIERVSRSLKLNTLQSVNLFDVYEGKQMAANKKSYAVSFIFLHPERTLTDKEIDKVMGKLVAALEKELGAAIRK